jgi:hypothetical protein
MKAPPSLKIRAWDVRPASNYRFRISKEEFAMLRILGCSVFVLILPVALVMAVDNKATHQCHGTFVKADLAKNTVTFKTKNKDGKDVEMTLPLTKDAKILGEDNKSVTLPNWVKNKEKEKDKSIEVWENNEGNQIVELRDMPTKTK